MQMLIFTGPAGATSSAAAATAALAAARGTGTLLASIGPSHALSAIVGVAPGLEPQRLGPNLDAWLLDPLADAAAAWSSFPLVSAGQVAGDELPMLPGMDLFLAVGRLRSFAPRYELVCVDAGPPDGLLRALAVPDTVRWAVRLLLGLDRGPGRSSASVARAIVPTALLPFPMEWTGNLQEARVRLEQLRDDTVDPQRTQVRYVLRPDSAGLQEALVALPALQLFGLAVERVVAGPLLDPDLRSAGLQELLEEQETAVSGAMAAWPEKGLLRLSAGPLSGDMARLAAQGELLYGGAPPQPATSAPAPVRQAGPPEPHVALDLPGLPREALGLTLSGDELIVRAGPYRRHLLLPEGLRGVTGIKATKQGETLIIRPRS
jgi:arsenite-transporting ATPase